MQRLCTSGGGIGFRDDTRRSSCVGATGGALGAASDPTPRKAITAVTAPREIPHIDAWCLLDMLNRRDREMRESLAHQLLIVWSSVDRMSGLLPDSVHAEIEREVMLAELGRIRDLILDCDGLGIRREMHACPMDAASFSAKASNDASGLGVGALRTCRASGSRGIRRAPRTARADGSASHPQPARSNP